MFYRPEEHLIIAITKSRLVESTLGDQDEVLDIVKGKGN